VSRTVRVDPAGSPRAAESDPEFTVSVFPEHSRCVVRVCAHRLGSVAPLPLVGSGPRGSRVEAERELAAMVEIVGRGPSAASKTIVGDHGHRHRTTTRQASLKRTAEQVLYRERTTGFEPATLTLAKKKREEIRPSGPSSALTWCPVRLFVRLVRPVRPDRIPVYHRHAPSRSGRPAPNRRDTTPCRNPRSGSFGQCTLPGPRPARQSVPLVRPDQTFLRTRQ
jgi:hypothetical protein